MTRSTELIQIDALQSKTPDDLPAIRELIIPGEERQFAGAALRAAADRVRAERADRSDYSFTVVRKAPWVRVGLIPLKGEEESWYTLDGIESSFLGLASEVDEVDQPAYTPHPLTVRFQNFTAGLALGVQELARRRGDYSHARSFRGRLDEILAKHVELRVTDEAGLKLLAAARRTEEANLTRRGAISDMEGRLRTLPTGSPKAAELAYEVAQRQQGMQPEIEGVPPVADARTTAQILQGTHRQFFAHYVSDVQL